MEHNFLDNLNEDVIYHLEYNYFLKRYAYWKEGEGCWIDNNNKKIRERMFTFILLHGKKWDNSTNLNFRESELHTVMGKYVEVLARVKAERKELLTAERAERKLYPRLTEWKFKNVTISVVEELKYYDRYPGIGEKSVSIYANGMPYNYGTDLTYPKDFAITTEWMFERIGNAYVRRYNVSKQTFNHKDFVSVTKHPKFKHSFVPYHFYIGYQVKVEDKTFVVYDAYCEGFEGMRGERFPVTIEQLRDIEVIGELQGLDAFIPLRNKLKYC